MEAWSFNQILIEKHSWRNSPVEWMKRECMVMACMVIVRQIIGIQTFYTPIQKKVKVPAFQAQCSSCNPVMT